LVSVAGPESALTSPVEFNVEAIRGPAHLLGHDLDRVCHPLPYIPLVDLPEGSTAFITVEFTTTQSSKRSMHVCQHARAAGAVGFFFQGLCP
jgi:hypothetical protein